MSHLTKDEVSPLLLRFRRDLRQVSGLRRDVAASSAQAGVRFQKGKTGELRHAFAQLEVIGYSSIERAHQLIFYLYYA